MTKVGMKNLLKPALLSSLLDNGAADNYNLTAHLAERFVDQMLTGRRCARRFSRSIVPLDGQQTYFIRLDVPGRHRCIPVKIGTSTRPLSRLIQLQVDTPYSLTLLGAVPGILLPETAMHERFAAHRLRGEWFSLDGDLRRFVEAVTLFGQNQGRHHEGNCTCGWDAFPSLLQQCCNPRPPKHLGVGAKSL